MNYFQRLPSGQQVASACILGLVRKTDRRHQQGEQSRAKILEATLAIAAERGYDGASIALVSEATGLPSSSIYWHFKNKDELLADTVEFSYGEWREDAPATGFPIDCTDPVSSIKDRLTRAAHTIAASPHFWRLGLMLGLRSEKVAPAARQRFLEVRATSAAGVHEWYSRLLPDLGAEPVEQLTRCHLAMIDGLYIGSFGDPDWWNDGAGERMVDLLAAGLNTTATRWKEET